MRATPTCAAWGISDSTCSPPVSKAVKTRWAWLCHQPLHRLSLASRVIGLFEHTISQLVALAA